ncbi:unannotated protein [freshwater metagenome]|uniref:Unannotated protein n=1 Tax=freshwater metagenome TaxID=449393 RepID=A0A6J7QGI5_9ZZZZ
MVLEQARDARGACRLAEEALLGGEEPVGGEDLVVGDGVDEAARLVTGRYRVIP